MQRIYRVAYKVSSLSQVIENQHVHRVNYVNCVYTVRNTFTWCTHKSHSVHTSYIICSVYMLHVLHIKIHEDLQDNEGVHCCLCFAV